MRASERPEPGDDFDDWDDGLTEEEAAELAVDRAWAGNTDYDALAELAGEKMSPPWVDDGDGYG